MREIKVLNREGLIEDRLKNKTATHVALFRGNGEKNRSAATAEIMNELIVEMPNNHWVDSKGYFDLWDEIHQLQDELLKSPETASKRTAPVDAAQAPGASVLEQLVEKIFIDITRRAQESPDLTSQIAMEETNFDFPETVNLRNILKYRGKFEQITGANDSVPLIEQNLAETDTFAMVMQAIGWKGSLKNLLFNSLHDMQKVLQAVVDADTDLRNSKTVGVIVGATYVASQQQAADATSGATFDAKMYNTLRKAVKKVRALKDIQTGRAIAVPSLTLLCNSVDRWDIERVIMGQLGSGNGTISGQNMQALPINTIIEYDRGINDGFTVGKKTISVPGVTAGKAYLFVPREYFYVGTKRPLTMETGTGSVLELSTEERAWYRVQGEYYKAFLGSSYPATSVGAGYGAIVEITLPTE